MSLQLVVVSRNGKFVDQLRELSMREQYLVPKESQGWLSLLFGWGSAAASAQVGPKATTRPSTFYITQMDSLDLANDVPEHSLVLVDAELLVDARGKSMPQQQLRPETYKLEEEKDCMLVAVVSGVEEIARFAQQYAFPQDDIITLADAEKDELLSALVMKQTMRNLRA